MYNDFRHLKSTLENLNLITMFRTAEDELAVGKKNKHEVEVRVCEGVLVGWLLVYRGWVCVYAGKKWARRINMI